MSNVGDDTIQVLSKRIVDSFKTSGFYYLNNHGMDENLVKENMEVSRKPLSTQRNSSQSISQSVFHKILQRKQHEKGEKR